MTKKLITKHTDSFNLDGATLESAIQGLQDILAQVGKVALVNVLAEYDGDTRMYVTYCAEETDEEYSYRLSEDNRRTAYRKSQYELLKKEFGE